MDFIESTASTQFGTLVFSRYNKGLTKLKLVKTFYNRIILLSNERDKKYMFPKCMHRYHYRT